VWTAAGDAKANNVKLHTHSCDFLPTAVAKDRRVMISRVGSYFPALPTLPTGSMARRKDQA